MPNYYLEFTLAVKDTSAQMIRDSLGGLGEGLEIKDGYEGDSGCKSFIIHIHSRDPTIIFDTCAQFGRIKQVKVNEATT